MSKISEVSVIQILKKNGLDYRNIIGQNSLFLGSLGVEYIVYDSLEGYEVLGFIKGFPDVRYFRKKFTSNVDSFLNSAELATGENLIYLKSSDTLNQGNLQKIESERPNLKRANLQKIHKIKNKNFKYDDFNFLMKENKSFFERLRAIFI